MKLSKSLFLAFAGLGLFACSNEDVTDNGGVQGDASVVVGIDLANLRGNGSRAVDATEETSDGQTTPVKLNSVVLTLESQTGGTQTYKFPTELASNPTTLTHTFDKVRNPTKISVSINGGTSEELHLKDIYNDGLAAPLYDYETNFGTATDKDGVLTYEVTLAPQHEIALLEFKGIKHEEHASEGCLFSSLTFDGMFLNGVKLHETTGGDATFANWVNAQDNADAPTFTVINQSFLKPADGTTPVFPSERGKCYAYNIFPEEGEAMPKLTLCFSNVTLNSGQVIAGWSAGNPLYAAVSKYKLTGIATETDDKISTDNQAKYGVDADGYLTKFMAGYVYKFKDLVVPDEAFGPTPEGGEDAKVIATVTITEWNIVNGTVEW